MKLPLRPSFLRPVVLSYVFIASLGVWSGYLQLQVVRLQDELRTTVNQDSVAAITQRVDGVTDRVEKLEQLKPVTIDDFRAGQQALSNRIDAAHALLKQIQQSADATAHTAATMEEVVSLEAKFDSIQLSFQELKKASEAVKQPPIAPKVATKAKTKKVDPPKTPAPNPPFTVIGVENRGGQQFLAVAPAGSTQLSQLNLIRPGDSVAGSNWRLSSLDDGHARFNIDGATRTIPLKP